MGERERGVEGDIHLLPAQVDKLGVIHEVALVIEQAVCDVGHGLLGVEVE